MAKSVTLVGLGNIGSHGAPLLAREAGVSRVGLCDFQKYERANVTSQSITAGEAGRGKALVQALRLQKINPALQVTAISRRVEDVPLGVLLRADVLLGAVDNGNARQYLSEAARRLGVHYVDAGVHADGMLARVSVYPAGADGACLECAWSQRDYDALEQTYPCQLAAGAASPASPGRGAPASGAPAGLGALAAAMQILETRRVLSGERPPVEGAFELVVDARTHRMLVTRLPPNAECRLGDHAPWRITQLRESPEELTLAQILRHGAPSTAGDRRLSLNRQPFVTRLHCLACGAEVEGIRLRRAIADRDRVCKSCRGRLEPAAGDLRWSLALDEVSSASHTRSLRSLGFEPHDIVTVHVEGDAVARHFELGELSAHAGATTLPRG